MEHAKARPLVRFFRRFVTIGAYAYPSALILLCIALVGIGESWWVTAALLYLPRALYALPLLFFGPSLWFMQKRKLLWTQLTSALIVVFPLMGFVLPWPAATPRGPTLKLLSLNVDSGYFGADKLLAAVDAAHPDLVLFQESPWGGALHEGLRARFPHVDASTQFLLGSRFPIVERTEPEKIPMQDRPHTARFMRYVVETSLGKLALYSVHPISPRGAFGLYGFRGMFHRIRTGEILAGDPEADLSKNAELRVKQVTAFQAMASKEHLPLLLAGDTNLPGLSALLRRQLSGYADGFSSASWGFGYTYPARRPFLRIDRVMAGPELGFSQFQIGCPGVSDHRCVIAQLFRR
jgi:endonuclease/exonuclease/phosphatase (EEP) superfamily protein YafD